MASYSRMTIRLFHSLKKVRLKVWSNSLLSFPRRRESSGKNVPEGHLIKESYPLRGMIVSFADMTQQPTRGLKYAPGRISPRGPTTGEI